jgi:hypothetical protein
MPQGGETAAKTPYGAAWLSFDQLVFINKKQCIA